LCKSKLIKQFLEKKKIPVESIGTVGAGKNIEKI
jgi:hypothetical protein